jgi:hypothetical protein
MKSKLGTFVCWGLLGCFFCFSARATEPLTVIDCEDKSLPLNPADSYSLVLLGTPKEEEKLRATGTFFDDQLSRSDFRLIVIVDLSRHPGRFIPIAVRKEMQLNLAHKKEWLKEHHYPAAPSGTYAMFSVPDFKGIQSKALGFPDDTKALRVVLFSPKGEVLQRWTEPLDPVAVRRLMP